MSDLRQSICDIYAEQEILLPDLRRCRPATAPGEMGRGKPRIQCNVYAKLQDSKTRKREDHSMRIRPCPHCGGTGAVTANYSYKRRCYFIFVRCDICGAQGKIFADPEDPAQYEWNMPACQNAIGAWNMRTYTGVD